MSNIDLIDSKTSRKTNITFQAVSFYGTDDLRPSGEEKFRRGKKCISPSLSHIFWGNSLLKCGGWHAENVKRWCNVPNMHAKGIKNKM